MSSTYLSILEMPRFLTLVPLQVPEVVRTDYQLIDISEDGFVSLNPPTLFPPYLSLGTLLVMHMSFNLYSSLSVHTFVRLCCLCTIFEFVRI